MVAWQPLLSFTESFASTPSFFGFPEHEGGRRTARALAPYLA